MNYTPRFFSIKELVDPDTYHKFGDASIQFLRPEALKMLDGVREFLGVPCKVNDWHQKGQFSLSGLRPFTSSVGAPYSAHRFGCAFDLKPIGITIQAAYAKINGAKDDPRVKAIRRIEDISFTPSWLHVDTFEHSGDRFILVKP